MREILAVVVLSGCSLIYNPNTLKGGDGRDGAVAADDAPADSPFVDSIVQPLRIYEGQGVDNSRPAVLTIRGTGFVAGGVTVTIAPTSSPDTADLTLGA